MAALDLLFPRFDVRLRRRVAMRSPPEEAVAAVLAAPAAPTSLVGLLLRLRGLPTGASVRRLFESLGLGVVSETPHEVVLAAAGRPWTPAGRIVPLVEAGPGDVRIAFAVRAVATSGGSLVECETRVDAVDARARRRFRLYWLVVGPFAGWIRVQWLRAATQGRAHDPLSINT